MSEGFDSRAVTRLRRSPRCLALAIPGILVGIPAFVAVLLTRRHDTEFLLPLVWLFLSLMLVLLVKGFAQRPEPTRVRANRQGAWIGDEFIRRSDILEAVIQSRSPNVVVQLVRRGAHLPVDLVMSDEEAGDHLVRAIGHDAGQIREVDIGADGILVGSGGRARYIHHSRIRDVSCGDDSLEAKSIRLLLNGGEVVEVVCRGRGSGARVVSILRRMKLAMKTFASSNAVAEASILGRGGRPFPEWIARLRALGVGASATHRTAPVVPERLWRVLEDPKALPSTRAAAAVALGPTLARDDRARLKAAAARATAPRLRIALEAAAEPAEDAALEAILAEVESEDHGTSAA